MNLLGHLVCASHLTPAAQLGSLLPDLLRLHRRELRAPNLARAWERGGDVSPSMTGLIAGVRFHLAVDSSFHRDPLFLENAGRLRTALRQASATPGLKRFLPAHVMTELYLDHLLILSQPELPATFHRLLDDAGVALTAEFIERDDRGDAAAFRAFASRFIEGRFLDGYRSLEEIGRRIQRVLLSCRQREMDAAETEAMFAVLSAGRVAMTEGLLHFVARMRDAEEPWAGRTASGGRPSARRGERRGRLSLADNGPTANQKTAPLPFKPCVPFQRAIEFE